MSGFCWPDNYGVGGGVTFSHKPASRSDHPSSSPTSLLIPLSWSYLLFFLSFFFLTSIKNKELSIYLTLILKPIHTTKKKKKKRLHETYAMHVCLNGKL